MRIGILLQTPSGSSFGGPYNMEEEEFERLKSDFLSFLEKGKPRGGAYIARKDRDALPQALLLRFEEIISCI